MIGESDEHSGEHWGKCSSGRAERGEPNSFYARMTPRQRAELDESIAQAERGEGEDAAAFFRRMARKHGFVRSARMVN